MGTKLLTFEEASEFTHIPVGTLKHMRLQRRGPRAGRIGRRVFYRQEDLQAWLDAQFAEDGPSAA